MFEDKTKHFSTANVGSSNEDIFARGHLIENYSKTAYLKHYNSVVFLRKSSKLSNFFFFFFNFYKNRLHLYSFYLQLRDYNNYCKIVTKKHFQKLSKLHAISQKSIKKKWFTFRFIKYSLLRSFSFVSVHNIYFVSLWAHLQVQAPKELV